MNTLADNCLYILYTLKCHFFITVIALCQYSSEMCYTYYAKNALISVTAVLKFFKFYHNF